MGMAGVPVCLPSKKMQASPQDGTNLDDSDKAAVLIVALRARDGMKPVDSDLNVEHTIPVSGEFWLDSLSLACAAVPRCGTHSLGYQPDGIVGLHGDSRQRYSSSCNIARAKACT